MINPNEASNHYFVERGSTFSLFNCFIYAVIGTFIVSILATNILFGTLVFENHFKAEQYNEFMIFSELKTITLPQDLLTFVDISLVSAISIVLGC